MPRRSVPKLRPALGGPPVVPKKPAEPLSALNAPSAAFAVNPILDQPIAKSLMIALEVVVLDVLPNDASQRRRVATPARAGRTKLG
jgi:hypothetical protein